MLTLHCVYLFLFFRLFKYLFFSLFFLRAFAVYVLMCACERLISNESTTRKVLRKTRKTENDEKTAKTKWNERYTQMSHKKMEQVSETYDTQDIIMSSMRMHCNYVQQDKHIGHSTSFHGTKRTKISQHIVCSVSLRCFSRYFLDHSLGLFLYLFLIL